MNLYHCTAYNADDNIRFHVRSSSDEDAVSMAKAETERIQRISVFIEDAHGRQVYDGPIGKSVMVRQHRYPSGKVVGGDD